MSEITFWEHQLEASRRAGEFPGYAFFMEMGTGKTGTAIHRLRTTMNSLRRHMRTLIFTPPLVVPQWKDEFAKFSKIPQTQIHLLQGTGKQRVKLFTEKAFTKGGEKKPGIFITNYETLLMKDLRAAFDQWEPENIIWDEAHLLKEWTSQRSKYAYELSNPWDMKLKAWCVKPLTYLLTGSPILKSPLDIFQQIKVMLGGWPTEDWFLDQSYRNLIHNPYHFRNKYFRDRNAGMPKASYFPKWEPATLERDGFDALGEIERTLSRISYRKKKDECLDLPDEISTRVPVKMTAPQAKAYQEMKSQLVAYLNGNAYVATMALTKALRLLQITSGFISTNGLGADEDIADFHFEDTPKIKALEELVATITPQSKVLIWAVWKENYKAISKLLTEMGVSFVEFHGGVSEAKKQEAIERFRTDPSIRAAVGHPGSGGVGLNLVVAPFSIFYSRNFNLVHFLQARARNHRGGQTEKVTHYDLTCEGTIDEIALDKNTKKIEMGAQLLGDLKKELAEQVYEF